MTESVLLNISLLPPPLVAAEVARLSAGLSHCGGLFVVDGIARRPHMTLFMARFPRDKVAEVQSSLGDFLRARRRFQVEHSGFFLTPGNYYEVSYRRTKPLLDLHLALTGRVSPLRFSPNRPVIEEHFAPYTNAQQESARTWGYDLVGELYRPHLTITRIGATMDSELPSPDVNLSFEATKVGLFEADALGATRKSIELFDICG